MTHSLHSPRTTLAAASKQSNWGVLALFQFILFIHTTALFGPIIFFTHQRALSHLENMNSYFVFQNSNSLLNSNYL